MKKVLLLHHCGGLGGAGMSLYSIILMLSNKYEVKTYCPTRTSDLALFLYNKGIDTNGSLGEIGMIGAYSGGPKTFTRTFWRYILKIKKSKKKLLDIIIQEKPDIIAVNSMTMAWAGKIIKKQNIKSICFVRETLTEGIWSKYIKYCLNHYFDGVIFISEYDMKQFNCSAPVIGVVRDCVDINDYSTNLNRDKACKRIGINDNFFNVLFVGGTSYLKGWTIILSAMEKLKNYNIKLIVAGEANITDKDMYENIQFVGLRQHMNILYRACDVLIFPSTSAHQARPAFEAGIMGLPVIISDFKETQEYIRDMENGLTFIPRDSSNLAEKILKLYKDQLLCRKLGQANCEKAVQYHEYEQNKKKLLNIIEEIEH